MEIVKMLSEEDFIKLMNTHDIVPVKEIHWYETNGVSGYYREVDVTLTMTFGKIMYK